MSEEWNSDKEKKLAHFLKQHSPLAPKAPINEKAQLLNKITTPAPKSFFLNHWKYSSVAVAAAALLMVFFIPRQVGQDDKVLAYMENTMESGIFLETESDPFDQFVQLSDELGQP